MTAIISTPEVASVQRLTALAGTIRAQHDEAGAAAFVMQGAVERGRAAVLICGQALREAKGLCRHGEFGPWVEQHCGFDVRTAQRYMQEAVPNTTGVSHLKSANALGVGALLKGIGRWLGRVKLEVILSWPDEDRARAATALEPLARLYKGLTEGGGK